MMLALTVGGWGIAMIVAVVLSVMCLLIAAINRTDGNEADACAWLLLSLVPPAIIFAAYGIYCWFGGTP